MPVLEFPPEFLCFGLTLIGVAIFHRRALWISSAGLTATIVYKLAFSEFRRGPGVAGLAEHFAQESVPLRESYVATRWVCDARASL